MRRIWRTLLLTALFTVLLGTAALAADTTKSGMYDVNGTGATLTPQTANGAAVTSTTTVDGRAIYAGTVRLGMTYTASGSEECLVMVTNKQTTSPAVSDIVYIDQVAASGGTAAFNLYPSSLTSGTTYYVYVSTASSSGLTKVGTFSYYAPYMLGDVDGDGSIGIFDAMDLVAHVAENITLEGNNLIAADVTGDGTVDIFDAMDLVAFLAGNIDKFKAEA